jgi:hypothetical protein
MVDFKRHDIDTKYLRSLCWFDGDLMDILGGSVRYLPDGTTVEDTFRRVYAYPFDSVKAHGDFAALYEACGTKGLLVDLANKKDLREINRSYYHAKDYRYPITLFTLPNGLDAIAHCPEEYCSLEIELLGTGDRLTKREYHSADIFHSNLKASDDGRYLLDNGWVWHPLNIVALFDIEEALKDPAHLDGQGLEVPGTYSYEPYNAIFMGHKVLIASILDHEPDEDDDEGFEILPAEAGVPESQESLDREKVRTVHGSDIVIVDKDGNEIRPRPTRKEVPTEDRHLLYVYDIEKEKVTSARSMPECLGDMMPVGEDHIVSFFDHPKLIEVRTGRVVHRWEDLDTGPERMQPSVMLEGPSPPYTALDPKDRRFAIGTKEHISVITIGDI